MPITINEHDAITDEYTSRPATKEEIAELEATGAAKAAEEAAKAEARLNLLERLGITEEEAKLLLA
jgi:hypothetical protein